MTSIIYIDPAVLDSLVSDLKDALKIPNVILFVGLPVIGKTTFFKDYLENIGYKSIRPVEAGGRVQCLQTLEEHLDKGFSVVIGM